MDELVVTETSAVATHGLSRTVTSKAPVARSLWRIILVCATFAFSYHLYLLTDRFIEHPVNIEMSLEAVRFRLPGLYICSTFLISSSRISSLPISSGKQPQFFEELLAISVTTKKTFIKLSETAERDILFWNMPDIGSALRTVF